MSFNTFFDLVRLEAIVSLENEESCLLNDLDLSNSFFDQLLGKEFVLLINIYHINVAFLVGSIQFLLLIVPCEASKDSLVGILKLIMGLFFPFGRFKPFKGLVIADCENQVFLNNE